MVELVALGAGPRQSALGSYFSGKEAALGLERAQIQNKGLQQEQIRNAMQLIGSVALGSMNGKLDGEPDPQKFEQGLDFLANQGVDVSRYRGKPGMAKVAARGSLEVLQQLQVAQNEQQMGLALRKFNADLEQAEKDEAYRYAQLGLQRERMTMDQNAPQNFTSPMPGVDAKGNPIFWQGSNTGAVKTVDGISPLPRVQKIDDGQNIILFDTTTQQVISTTPKQNFQEASEKAAGAVTGKTSAEAQMNLPGASVIMDRIKTDINRVLTFGAGTDEQGNVIGKPTVGQFVGKFKGTVPNAMPKAIQSQERVNFNALVEKVKSGTFAQAYEIIRGAGPIAIYESQMAAQALANMDTAQDETQFRQAMQDFQTAVEAGFGKIAAQSQMGNPRAAPSPAPGPQPQQQGPKPGDIEDGHRFKGGNPANPNSWEKVN